MLTVFGLIVGVLLFVLMYWAAGKLQNPAAIRNVRLVIVIVGLLLLVLIVANLFGGGALLNRPLTR